MARTISRTTRVGLLAFGGLLSAGLHTPSGLAQTVLARARLGNNTEAITFVNRGNGRNIAVMDGYDVFEVSLGAQTGAPVPPPVSCDPSNPGKRRGCRRLFDVRHLGAPRGIVYVPSQDRYYFGNFDPNRLDSTDPAGQPLPALSITYLPGTDPGQILQFEGLSYIPPESPVFPDTIAALTLHANFVSRVQIIGLDGVVQQEIAFPAGSPLYAYLVGVAYRHPGRLLLTPSTQLGLIYEAAFDGAATGPVATIGEAQTGLEGLTTTDDGRVVSADYTTGVLYVLDAELQRRATQDREYKVGLGISLPAGLAWNADSDEFLVTHVGSQGGVFALPTGLNRVRQVVDFSGTLLSSFATAGIAYLPDEHLIAVTQAFGAARGVGLFNSAGTYVSRIALDPANFPGQTWNPVGVAPFPGNSLVLRIQRSTTLRTITRDGTPDPGDPTAIIPTHLADIPLSSPSGGGGLSLYDLPGDDELLAGRSFYDLNGNLLRTFDSAALGLGQISAVTPITSGRYQGAFAATDSQNSELVVFTLP